MLKRVWLRNWKMLASNLSSAHSQLRNPGPVTQSSELWVSPLSLGYDTHTCSMGILCTSTPITWQQIHNTWQHQQVATQEIIACSSGESWKTKILEKNAFLRQHYSTPSSSSGRDLKFIPAEATSQPFLILLQHQLAQSTFFWAINPHLLSWLRKFPLSKFTDISHCPVLSPVSESWMVVTPGLIFGHTSSSLCHLCTSLREVWPTFAFSSYQGFLPSINSMTTSYAAQGFISLLGYITE